MTKVTVMLYGGPFHRKKFSVEKGRDFVSLLSRPVLLPQRLNDDGSVPIQSLHSRQDYRLEELHINDKVLCRIYLHTSLCIDDFVTQIILDYLQNNVELIEND